MSTTTSGSKPQYNYKKIWQVVENYERISKQRVYDILIFQVSPYFFAFGKDARQIINVNRLEDQPLLAETPPLSEPLILDRAEITRQIGLLEEGFYTIKIMPAP